MSRLPLPLPPPRPLALAAPPAGPAAPKSAPQFPTAGQFGPVRPAFRAKRKYTGRQVHNRLLGVAARILRVKRNQAVAALVAHHLVGSPKARLARRHRRRAAH